MGLVHGVDDHFAFVSLPPTGTASFCFSASMISIGLSATAARIASGQAYDQQNAPDELDEGRYVSQELW